jgi:phosphoserine aminotransferase
MLLTFNPGPAKVYPELRQYLLEAHDEGILQMGHRSDRFVQLSKAVVADIKTKLNVPAEYSVYFTSSATESWEIIAQSLTRSSSLHFYNGAFGEKWFQTAKALRPNAVAHPFDVQEALDARGLPSAKGVEVVCVTHNETSNGTQVDATTLQRVTHHYREALVCVDATSSLGGANLRYGRADVWYGSVQKCLGLPAGLGLLICSPRTLERAKEIGHRNHYNALLSIHEKMLNFQTTHTPNVLGIYLLHRVLQQRLPIKAVNDHLAARAEILYKFFEENFPQWTPLVTPPELRSQTVLALTCAPGAPLDELKKAALAHGLHLGNGYGAWAKTTFRIANFPQHQDQELVQLQRFLVSVGTPA